MKEQSHKDEMSAAIRGDFRRLRERGVAATLTPRDEERRDPDPVAALPKPEPEPVPEPTAREPAIEPEAELEHEALPGLEPEIEAGQPVDEPLVNPGFLARLLGR